MALLTKEALLGANDLEEREVELPSIGGSVRIRALSAAFSSEASSEALEMETLPTGEQKARVNTVKLEAIQVYHALADPKLESIEESERFLQNCGPAANKLTAAIRDISGISAEEVKAAEARFPGSGTDAARSNGGSEAGA